ncbi:hypothetical protein CO051_00665, partial [Candidatus Roizmanbacteria bacterium CG_4_9_14_0_2_um_filter_39_13]
DFMEKERIGYLAVGSSCCTLNGDLMRRPNDIDIFYCFRKVSKRDFVKKELLMNIINVMYLRSTIN